MSGWRIGASAGQVHIHGQRRLGLSNQPSVLEAPPTARIFIDQAYRFTRRQHPGKVFGLQRLLDSTAPGPVTSGLTDDSATEDGRIRW